MFLIVGLGNVGDKYKYNIHNAGFIFADILQDRMNFQWSDKFKSSYGVFNHGSSKVFVQKPSTYMNSSGEAALAIQSFYKIQPQNIIVVHDDIDLKDGDIRMKCGGGHGGHNGLRSIDAMIGSGYWRVRVGTGRPDNKGDVANFVLGDFKRDSLENIVRKYHCIIDNFDMLLGLNEDKSSVNKILSKISLSTPISC